MIQMDIFLCNKMSEKGGWFYSSVRHIFNQRLVFQWLREPIEDIIMNESFTGLPRMLVYVGGVEIFRSMIELFTERARQDGVEVQLEVGEGRSHDYIMVPQICLDKEILEAHEKMSAFMARNPDQQE